MILNSLICAPGLEAKRWLRPLDMATVFDQAKDRYLDKQAGMRLRQEIYAQGDSRDVTLSIEKFLGRKRAIEPFLKKIGVN